MKIMQEIFVSIYFFISSIDPDWINCNNRLKSPLMGAPLRVPLKPCEHQSAESRKITHSWGYPS